METRDERYDEIIGKLKNIEPELFHSSLLTGSIMEKVSINNISRTIKIIQVVRPWLAIASLFLIGLFVYQHTETPEPLPSKEVVFAEEMDATHACLDSIAGDTNRIENLIELYLCYLQHEEIKKRNSEFLEQQLLFNSDGKQ